MGATENIQQIKNLEMKTSPNKVSILNETTLLKNNNHKESIKSLNHNHKWEDSMEDSIIHQ